MKLTSLVLICVCLAGVARAEEVAPLNVLYAGNPGSPREAEFVELLQNNGAAVGKIRLTDVTKEAAANYDVVILDWTSVMGKGADGQPSLDMPPIPKLSDDYDRPTILIGAVAGHYGNTNKLKISWLCLCLNESAHGMKTNHEIFNTPLKVKLEMVDAPTPPNYHEYAFGEELPQTMKVLPMQTKMHPAIDPGLVSPPDGFEDSPDSEAISGGLNMKGPKSVAIGRQGNLLQWGFSASPSDMTEAGHACFVNCVSYIRKFDGHRPLVQRKAPSREGLVTMLHFVQKYPQLRDYLTPELIETLGGDQDKWSEQAKANLEYISGPEEYKFGIDTDVKAMGVSNRKIESLETWIGMMEKDDDAARARKLLTRFTDQTFDAAADWRKWLNENRDRLFFSDVGGYRWFAKPQAAGGK